MPADSARPEHPTRPARPARGARRDRRDFPVEQMRERLSSYVYGNITVLAATIAVTPDAIRHGGAIAAVLATALTTYVAHVLSHVVGHSVAHEGDPREAVGVIVRNANPIATSAGIPVVLYAAAWFGWVPPEWAQIAASVVLVVRIGMVGFFVQRFSGRKPSFLGLWGGIVLAAVALVISLVKVVLTH
jgi:hypothetical protein